MRSLTRAGSLAVLLLASLPAPAAQRDPGSGKRLLEVQVVESLALPARAPSGTSALRVTHPAARDRFPVIVLSQGARSAPAMYDYLARYWAARGYIVLQPLPPELSPLGVEPRAASPVRLPATIEARVGDIRFTLAQLSQLEAGSSALRGRLDRARIALAGHSIGALASLLAADPDLAPLAGEGESGAATETARPNAPPAGIGAVVLIGDPSRGGIVPEAAWQALAIPVLLVTGDLDEGEIPSGVRRPAVLFAVREAGTASANELFVRGMDVCLGGLLCRMAAGTTPDPAAQAAIAEVSSAFLHAFLRRDAQAANRLTHAATADLANGRASLKVVR